MVHWVPPDQIGGRHFRIKKCKVASSPVNVGKVQHTTAQDGRNEVHEPVILSHRRFVTGHFGHADSIHRENAGIVNGEIRLPLLQPGATRSIKPPLDDSDIRFGHHIGQWRVAIRDPTKDIYIIGLSRRVRLNPPRVSAAIAASEKIPKAG